MASSPIMSMKPPRIGTHCLATSARGPRQSAARRNRVGLDARKDPRRPAGGEKCLLTSPFIGLPIGRLSIAALAIQTVSNWASQYSILRSQSAPAPCRKAHAVKAEASRNDMGDEMGDHPCVGTAP